MSNPNDFDILSDDQEGSGRSSRLLWLLIIAGAVFLFAVGMAVATFTNRLGNDDPVPPEQLATVTETVTSVAVAPTAEATATITGAPTAQQGAEPTATTAAVLPSPTATLPPAPTVTPVPTAGCTIPLIAQFTPAYRNELGCPTTDAGIIWAAWEWFERGAMFWRSDNDRAYAFIDTNPSDGAVNGGGWMPIDEKWEGQELPSRGDAPPGLQTPQRGFGYAWARSDTLFQQLGWATDQERGFCALIQSFERGFIFQSSDVEVCQDNLFNQARTGEWQPLFIVALEGGGWANLAATTGTVPVVTPTAAGGDLPTATATAIPAVVTVADTPTPIPTEPAPAPESEQRQRPDGNRIFTAPAVGHTLDADFGDWGEDWITISAVAEGGANYGGGDDVSGEFQLSWSLEGLYLAVRVRDDRYRPGPDGSEMWQGDTLELHFDRRLGADFEQTFSNEDDYQLGLSWGPNRNETRLYRWLPLAKEGLFPITGAVAPENEGYRAEVLIPWTLLDVTGDDLRADQRFGFNLSISDNDADAPAQETILSASPSRTTYNNPVEWGTLILQ